MENVDDDPDPEESESRWNGWMGDLSGCMLEV
jgi:hypothetical protein